MNFWLVKSEPETYSWDDFCRLGTDHWSGVRNFQARNHLKNMQVNDLVLFYHSQTDRAVVGIAKVVKTAYPDPTTDDVRWVAVDMSPVVPFKQAVTLQQIKQQDRLAQIALIRQSRLSVMPLTPEEFAIILDMGHMSGENLG